MSKAGCANCRLEHNSTHVTLMQGSCFLRNSHREASHPRHSVLPGRHTGYRRRRILLWIAVRRPSIPFMYAEGLSCRCCCPGCSRWHWSKLPRLQKSWRQGSLQTSAKAERAEVVCHPLQADAFALLARKVGLRGGTPAHKVRFHHLRLVV